jgi:hypothetical protein
LRDEQLETGDTPAMAVLRFLASLFALIAVLAFVTDATPALIGTGPFKANSVIGYWRDLTPSTLVTVRAAVTHATSPWVWDSMIASVLNLPASVLFGVLAIVCGYFGRRHEPMKMHIN